jgi:dTMP kinase
MKKSNNKKTIYITIDGGDGAGKSTFIKNLNILFTSLNKKVFFTKEFGSSHDQFCEMARGLALSSSYNVDELAGQIAFAAIARQHQQKVVKPTLLSNEYDFIVSDRGVDSNYAYGPEHVKEQGIKDKVISELFKIAYIDAPSPDITFYLDVDTEITKKRRDGRSPETELRKKAPSFKKK